MKICLVNGSIKDKRSASAFILDNLENKLENSMPILRSDWKILSCDLPESCNAFVFAFPLYMDGIPSNFMETLELIEKDICVTNPNAKIYIIVNNAFYEPVNNIYAVRIMKQWCRNAHLEFSGALCIGAGPIIGKTPLGTGTMKNLDKGLDVLADAIHSNKDLAETSNNELFIEPNCTLEEYMSGANMNWTVAAEKRGFTDDDLRAKP